MKIVSVGEITIDRYVRQNLSFVGGISLNFAVNARRSGAEQVSLVSVVGDDVEGEWVIETLQKEKINTENVAVLTGRTADIDIQVYEDASRVFSHDGFRENVLKHLQLTNEIKTFIQEHHILVSNFDHYHSAPLIHKLLEIPNTQIKRVVDFGDWSKRNIQTVPLDILHQIDLAFFSGTEATLKGFQSIAFAAKCLLVVTMGAAGSAALRGKEMLTQSAIEVPHPVDSTGCGDAFQAAFTVNYFKTGNIESALFEGAAQAARVLTHFGAFDQPQI